MLVDRNPEARFVGARIQVSKEWFSSMFGVQPPKITKPLDLPWVWEVFDLVGDRILYVPDQALNTINVKVAQSAKVRVGLDEEPHAVRWSRIPFRKPDGSPRAPIASVIYDQSCNDPRHFISPLGRRADIFRAKNAALLLARERAETDVDTYVVHRDLYANDEFMGALRNPVPNQVLPIPAGVAELPLDTLVRSLEKRGSSPAMDEFMRLIDAELAATNAAVGAQAMGIVTGVTATEVGIANEYTRQSLSRYRLRFHEFLAECVDIASSMASLLCGDLPWVAQTPEGARAYTGAYLALDWSPTVIDLGVQSGTQVEQRREWPALAAMLAEQGADPASLFEETLRRNNLDPNRFPRVQPQQAAPTPASETAPAIMPEGV